QPSDRLIRVVHAVQHARSGARPARPRARSLIEPLKRPLATFGCLNIANREPRQSPETHPLTTHMESGEMAARRYPRNMKFHVGCAMWTYAAWQGRYLPPALPPRERLRAYATWCNAVEGNTTFYATPALSTVRSWAEQTAPDFRFILKLPKPITH